MCGAQLNQDKQATQEPAQLIEKNGVLLIAGIPIRAEELLAGLAS